MTKQYKQLQSEIMQLKKDYAALDANYQKAIERMNTKEIEMHEFKMNQIRINKVVEELWKRAGSFENDNF